MSWAACQRRAVLVSILLAPSLGGCPQPGRDFESDGGIVGGDRTPGTTPGDGDARGGGDEPTDPTNRAPTASLTISPGLLAKPAALVTLDASGSSDPDGDALTFAWLQTAGPGAGLSATTGPTVTFVAPLAVETSTLEFTVTVSDGRGGQASATGAVVVEVGAEFAGHPQSALPYRESLTSDEAYHLLRRAAFGGAPKDVTLAVSRGLTATLDDLLSIRPIPKALGDLAHSYGNDAAKRWLLYMIEGPNPLQERMTLFWHDRFAASKRVLAGGTEKLAVLHLEMLRRNALGSYRNFLEELTLDPLMLIWLDGANSPKENPNENYTREFWELFTLGRDVLYTESDIREGARAFTGITLLYESGKDPRPIFDLLHHDETLKVIFPGRAAPANHDYRKVIDLTLAQPEAARYVARNLFTCFVHDHPDDALLDDLAAGFVASNFEIAPLLRRILASQAMFSTDARGNQVASPVEHYVGVARTFEQTFYSEESQGYVFDQLVNDLANAGQELLNPPGVEGWTEDEGWLQDQWVLNRAKALGRTMEYSPYHLPYIPLQLLPPQDTWKFQESRDRIVDGLAAALHLTLTPAERAAYLEVLDQGGKLYFHHLKPEQQPKHVFELVRLMCLDERVIGR